MTYEEWKATATEYAGNAPQHILDVTDADVPYIEFSDGSWIVINDETYPTRVYWTLCQCEEIETADRDEAIKFLWEHHAKYEHGAA